MLCHSSYTQLCKPHMIEYGEKKEQNNSTDAYSIFFVHQNITFSKKKNKINENLHYIQNANTGS